MNEMNPKEIKTHPTFESLFPISPAVLTKIEQDMRNGSYDFSQPIILATWDGQKEPVCIDGHTRLKAATNVGIEKVPVHSYEFESEEDAFEYAIRLQSNRRNLTDGDLIHCIERIHERRPRGGDRRSDAVTESTPQSCGKKKGRSAAAMQTAEKLNISARKVEQALTVINYGSPEVKEAVLKNEMSINKAYLRTQKERKQAEVEASTDKSEPQPTAESQDAEQGDEDTESSGSVPVLLSSERFKELYELGGLVEDHLDCAAQLYLEYMRAQAAEKPEEADQNQDGEDDDDEYFDPDSYDSDDHETDEQPQREEEHEVSESHDDADGDEPDDDDDEYFNPDDYQDD